MYYQYILLEPNAWLGRLRMSDFWYELEYSDLGEFRCSKDRYQNMMRVDYMTLIPSGTLADLCSDLG